MSDARHSPTDVSEQLRRDAASWRRAPPTSLARRVLDDLGDQQPRNDVVPRPVGTLVLGCVTAAAAVCLLLLRAAAPDVAEPALAPTSLATIDATAGEPPAARDVPAARMRPSVELGPVFGGRFGLAGLTLDNADLARLLDGPLLSEARLLADDATGTAGFLAEQLARPLQRLHLDLDVRLAFSDEEPSEG